MNKVLIIIAFLLFIGCVEKNKSTQNTYHKSEKNRTVMQPKHKGQVENRESQYSQIDKKHGISSYPQIDVDTIIDDVYIKYSLQDNQNTFSDTIVAGDGKREVHYYADRSLLLNVERKGKTILREKVFDKSSFASIVPKSELGKNLISFVAIRHVLDMSITLFMTICKPDSDVCYFIEMSISNDGKVTLKELDESEIEE